MSDDRQARIERAFVAGSYLLGARGEALCPAGSGAEASELSRTLASSDKQTRALALAREIARIAVALDDGALR